MDIAVERYVNYPAVVLLAALVSAFIFSALVCILGKWGDTRKLKRFGEFVYKVAAGTFITSLLVCALSSLAIAGMMFVNKTETDWSNPQHSSLTSNFMPYTYVSEDFPDKDLNDVLHDEYGLSKDIGTRFYKDKAGKRLECYIDTALHENKNSVHLTVKCKSNEYHELKPIADK